MRFLGGLLLGVLTIRIMRMMAFNEPRLSDFVPVVLNQGRR